MSRLGYLTRHPKKSLSALGTLMLAAGLTVGSGAYFTDTSTSIGNSAKAGTVAIQLFGSSDPAVNGNNCRNTTDDFTEPAGYTGECSVAGIDNNAVSGLQGETFTVENLSPGAPTITRCFQVQNDSDVPVGLRAVLTLVGNGAPDLDDVLTAKLYGVGGTLANSLPWGSVAAAPPVLANHKSLATIASLGGIKADEVAINAPTRIPLEPSDGTDGSGPDEQKYCIDLNLPETGLDQAAIEGETLTFNLAFTGRSLNHSTT